MRKTDRIIRTNCCGCLVAGLAFIALVGVTPGAQAGTTGNGWSQPNPAAAAPQHQTYDPNDPQRFDKDLANRCKADPEHMMGTKLCIGARRRHPELFASSEPGSYEAAVPPPYSGYPANPRNATGAIDGVPISPPPPHY